MVDYIEIAKKLYNTSNDDYFYHADYTPILNYFGDIIHRYDEDDWQGDTYVIIKDRPTNKIGYLCFGWGSCSGCDALQACNDYKDLSELIERLENSIIWKNNSEEMIEWLNTRDWRGEYVWHNENLKLFLPTACEKLGGKCTVNFDRE